MTLHFDPHVFIVLLSHYGSVGLFILLALGIFGLPIPDETLLVLSGFLMAKGHLSLLAIPVAAILGASFGITLSYLLGFFAGKEVLLKYGKWVGLTHEKIERAHSWFERFGKWFLLIGYYIPGVRHLTGFIAGTVFLSYWQFALFAYLGAALWSLTFLTIGYFFYNAWQHLALPLF
jgi:membrane protein DedA with SNARE-associated domain